MAEYAFISGDEYTQIEPVAFVYDNGTYEVICSSYMRALNFYDSLRNGGYKTFDQFLSTFSYYNVERGDVTPKVESHLNQLRAKFGLQQLANAQIQSNQTEAEKLQAEKPQRDMENALASLGQRMRTGKNEH